MRLLTLELQNFQAIRSLRIDLQGKDVEIRGDNATGKTTIANAYTWLLTGKAYTNEPGFSPQTIEGGELAHHLDHGVAGTFQADDGTVFTLERIYKEVWRKQRGRAEEELTGGETGYWIDSVPVRATDYAAFVTEMFGTDEAIQILSKPEFFCDTTKDMSWQKRREIIMRLTDDVTDADVIARDTELADLSELIKKPGTSGAVYTMDELTAIARAERKKLQDDMKAIPERIDEITRLIPPHMSDDVKQEKQARLEELRAQSLEKRERVKQLEAADDQQVVQRAIVDKEIAIQERVLEIRQQHEKASEGARMDYETAQHAIRALRDDVAAANEQARAATTSLETVERRRQELMDRLRELNAERFDGETICPTCGQNLPADEVELARAKFNTRLSRDKESVLAQLNDSANSEAHMEELRAKILEASATADMAGHNLARQQERAEALRNAIPTLPADALDADTVIVGLRDEIAHLRTGNTDSGRVAELDEMNREIREIYYAAQAIKTELEELDNAARFQTRIEELKKEMRDAADQLELAEKKIYLAERFVVRKADMLSAEINKHFDPSVVSFKLFHRLKNGGVEPTCEVLVRSAAGDFVEFKAANRAGRINAGLEVIKTLAHLYNRTLPIIVDNAESVTRLTRGAGQMVTLYVTRDPVLEIEIQGEQAKQDWAF